MKKLFIISFILLPYFCSGQQPIDVAELTIKIQPNSTKDLYYGFPKGDQIVFTCSEINGKNLKEIEITEYPETSKFKDYETSKIENKKILVDKKNVYKFRIRNNQLLSGRVCRIKIQRIPQDENSINFDTSVKWVSIQDTTWNSYTKEIQVGYDTLFITKKKKVIDVVEKNEEILLDKTERIHSKTNRDGNIGSVFFRLPQNQVSPYESKKVIAWAYWVGVGEESNKSWQQNRKTISTIVQGIAGLTLSPLGAFALGAVTNLSLPTIGEDVSYALVNETNKELYSSGAKYKSYDYGKGIAGYKKFTDSNLQGSYYILLTNDNIIQGIDVNIKVSAIIEYIKYKDQTYNDIELKPRYEKQIFREPIFSTRIAAVTADHY